MQLQDTAAELQLARELSRVRQRLHEAHEAACKAKCDARATRRRMGDGERTPRPN